jgi:hypothetical protein
MKEISKWHFDAAIKTNEDVCKYFGRDQGPML